ncbi:unnamed protein product [Polarella glacialis]|uniref:Kinesin motor domain-containing protein n=1 Tax=Polarella glacialis TaxID=89957 RepID=A0A813HNJ5_POLGL|nr:unnamed protein product [Polarella glacialis]
MAPRDGREAGVAMSSGSSGPRVSSQNFGSDGGIAFCYRPTCSKCRFLNVQHGSLFAQRALIGKFPSRNGTRTDRVQVNLDIIGFELMAIPRGKIDVSKLVPCAFDSYPDLSWSWLPWTPYTFGESYISFYHDNDTKDKRRMAVFFLDPAGAQLLADIRKQGGSRTSKKDKDDEDDDDDDEDDDSKEASDLLYEFAAAVVAASDAVSEKKVKKRSLGASASDKEFIQVVIRVRPLLERNLVVGDRNILEVDTVQNTIDVEMKGSDRKQATPVQVQESPSTSNRETVVTMRSYKFDHVMDSRFEGQPNFASQEAVYELIGSRIVRCAMDGYNACLFAYGQTGTGKTHTVLGNTYPSEKRGLLPRILEGLFEELAGRKEASEAKDSSVQISYLEIFNEQIHDLLVPPPKSGVPREALQVRYHPILGVMINDLTQSSCSTIEEAMELVDFGTRMRSIAATSMNSRSSRAHTVFTFKFEQTSRDGETQMAQIQLVDLAGREQEKSSSDNKDRLRERQFINTSLFHLSTCILNLSRGSKAREVCAFRNSRLTLLLANSLSGNSRTGMIAAVSPASSDLDETISTLRFADHVKKIRTSANCNKVNKASVVKQLQEEIAKLRAQMDLNVRTGDGEKVSQLEAICAHFKEALEQEKSRSQALAAERAECLKEMGLSVGAESVSIVVGADRDGGVPYLVNLSDDPYLQGCLMYFLKGPEDVTIGSADSNKVRMSGLGIKAQHCIIRNEGNRRLFLHPLTDGAENEKERPRVFLNGRRVTDPVEMHHQDRIILGHSCAFRVAVPLTASELKAQKEGGSSGPEGGTDDQAEVEFDQALAEIEDASTQSFGNLGKYVEDLEHSVGREVARAFVCELRRAVPLVDEANQITREMAQDFVFALQVLTDLCSSKTTAPEMVVAVTGTAGSRELKFVWTLEKFTDRLQSMRDLYEEIGDGSNIRVLQRKLEEEPYNNPWREIGDGEVRMMIDGLNAGGKIDPIIFVSQSSSRSVHPKAGRVHSLEAKSDELLARSQFLLEEGTAVLQRVPVLRPRSPTIDSCFDCNGEGESGLEQLELEVAEGMKKLSQWYNIGRRASISNTSSHLAALRERALTEGSARSPAPGPPLRPACPSTRMEAGGTPC